MDIFVTGVTGMGNRGVEALLTPIVHRVRDLYPDDDIRVLSRDWKEDARRGADLPCTFEPDWFLLMRSRTSRARERLQRLLPGRRAAIADLAARIRKARVVISTGGDVFSADYGDQQRHLEPLEHAIKGKVPVVMLAHSVGPYKNDDDKQAWADVASKSALVTIREPLSFDYVTRDIGLRGDSVRQTADVAFLLQPPPDDETAAMVNYYGLDPDRPIVACAVSRGISRFRGLSTSSEETSRRHFESWVRIIRHITDHLGANALLIPHVQDAGNNNDLLYCSELVRAGRFDRRVCVAWGDHRAAEYKGLISHAKLVIAERMHAGIGALSTATPTMLVKYSVKAEGVLRDLVDDHLLASAMTTLEDFLDPDTAVREVQRAWDDRRSLKQSLKHSLPTVKCLAEENFTLLKQAVP